MNIELNNIKPNYMSEAEISASDIYLQKSILFEKEKLYLIKAGSGRGKTSLLNFIYGMNLNYSGTIRYPMHSSFMSFFDLRKDKLSYMFQDFKLFQNLTTFENIKIKNSITNHKTDREIIELITKVGLKDKINTEITKLSLGQRQRIALIRAVCQPFDFILMDEPFSHLDNENIKIATEIINTELNKNRAGLILCTLENEYYFNYHKKYKL